MRVGGSWTLWICPLSRGMYISEIWDFSRTLISPRDCIKESAFVVVIEANRSFKALPGVWVYIYSVLSQSSRYRLIFLEHFTACHLFLLCTLLFLSVCAMTFQRITGVRSCSEMFQESSMIVCGILSATSLTAETTSIKLI